MLSKRVLLVAALAAASWLIVDSRATAAEPRPRETGSAQFIVGIDAGNLRQASGYDSATEYLNVMGNGLISSLDGGGVPPTKGPVSLTIQAANPLLAQALGTCGAIASQVQLAGPPHQFVMRVILPATSKMLLTTKELSVPASVQPIEIKCWPI